MARRLKFRSEKREKLVPTSLQFYPNYSGNQVRVFFTALTNGWYRVGIWGEDDYGYEFDTPSRPAALDMYRSIERVDSIPAVFVRG